MQPTTGVGRVEDVEYNVVHSKYVYAEEEPLADFLAEFNRVMRQLEERNPGVQDLLVTIENDDCALFLSGKVPKTPEDLEKDRAAAKVIAASRKKSLLLQIQNIEKEFPDV